MSHPDKGKVMISTDCGVTWSQLLNLTDDCIISIAVTGNNIYAGTDMGGIYISHDFGQSWAETALNENHVSAIATNGNQVFAGTRRE